MWFHRPCSELAVMEFLASWNCNSASIGILIKKSRGSYLDQIDKSIFSQFWMNWIQLKLIEPVLRNSIVCKRQRHNEWTSRNKETVLNSGQNYTAAFQSKRVQQAKKLYIIAMGWDYKSSPYKDLNVGWIVHLCGKYVIVLFFSQPEVISNLVATSTYILLHSHSL